MAYVSFLALGWLLAAPVAGAIPQAPTAEELRAWLQQNPVDYLLISQRELKERKKLKPLGDPTKAPPWLKPVWSNVEPPAVLYQPNLQP